MAEGNKMKHKEVWLTLLLITILAAGLNIFIELGGYSFWLSIALYTSSFLVSAFMVLLTLSIGESFRRRQRRIKELFYKNKVSSDKRDKLLQEQDRTIDWNLTKRKVDWILVQEEIESIKQEINSSIEYEQNRIETKQATIQGYKELLDELDGVKTNGEINKET